jgi:antirestriction protein ArdC
LRSSKLARFHGNTSPFWQFFHFEDKQSGETKEIPFLRYSSVFNVEQTEGVKYPSMEEQTTRDTAPIEAAEAVIAGMPNPPKLVIDDTREAYYSPQGDLVHMTKRSACVSDERYYETLLHELVHSTGHKSLLRFVSKRTDAHTNSVRGHTPTKSWLPRWAPRSFARRRGSLEQTPGR